MENEALFTHPFDGKNQATPPWYKKYGNHILVAVGIFLVLGVVIGLIVGLTLKAKPSAEALMDAVTVANIKVHLTKLQEIAFLPKNKGSRGVLEGYDDCLEYVKSTLAAKTGCVLSTQQFDAPIYYELSPPQMTFTSATLNNTLQLGVDFTGLRYGGNGTYNLVSTVQSVGTGCLASDFAGFTAGHVALTHFSSDASVDCTPIIKASNAANAGASAVLIANDLSRKTLNNYRVRGDGYFPGDTLIQIPVLLVTHSVGETLVTTPDLKLTIQTNNTIIVAETHNLYCTTPGGDANNLVVIGAHLDSVPAGPGLNDNASGSATLLEVVLQFFRLKFKPTNKIQFSWWGAEEVGLLGSRAFVNYSQQHNPDFFKTIKMAINFDMLASPNGLPEVHSIHVGNPTFPTSAYNGSDAITSVFQHHFNNLNIPVLLNGMAGGSDYYPFVQAGIPAGGLATGAGQIKTMEERITYGGLANAAMDPCYHQPCDTLENIGTDMLLKMSMAAADAIGTFALEKDLNAFLAKGGH